ncbi:MAG TPA: glycoside hydrolase family 43 protein [Gemmatimonadaceae bacterium]|nr:glycoside hydrolase family 43 protein [Gemmatimonadaceae bacterium]
MTFKYRRGLGLTLLVLAACTSPAGVLPPPPPPTTCTFTNPIGTGADPWVVKSGSFYYLVESRDNGIYVYKSETLTSPKQNATQVWAAPDTGWNRTNVWAPELHPIDGRWYIYYAAGRSGPPFISQRAGVLQSVGSDPQGQYVDKGMLYTGDNIGADPENVWAIDLTVSRINGQLYAVWSGWAKNAQTDRTPQNLYIAKMSNPWTISTNRALLSTPDATWEKGTELDLQEGPEFLEHAGQEFIIYSTRESWLPEYKLGQLRLKTLTSDPMDRTNFIKTGPVFTGTTGVYGVGHASFTSSPDNTEDWIVYHSKVDPAPGWNRVIRTQKFTWNADGSPNFGTPAASGQTVTVPSGECKS